MKNRLWIVFWALTATLYTAVAYCSSKTEQCVEPDHFLSYDFVSENFLTLGTVALHDQFIGSATAFVAFTIVDGVRLLNPATKFYKGEINEPKYPNTHYLAVSLAVPIDATAITVPTGLKLQVFNQFGNLNLTTADFLDTNPATPAIEPQLELLVPSLKLACPAGDCKSDCKDCFPEGDHYLCYTLNVQEPICLAANPHFKDQFLERIAEDLVPIRLCNPVDKTLNGVTTIANPLETNHLLCYTISNKRIPPRFVQTLNQLGQQRGVVKINSDVCVPSKKIELTPPCANATPSNGMCNGICATGLCIDFAAACTCITAVDPCSIATGTCGGTCTAVSGQTCQISNSTCACACPAAETACGAACTNTETDVNNCGSCGNICATGGSCAGGVCECPPNNVVCNGVCKNTMTDPNNCGACGHGCPQTQPSCISGTCTVLDCTNDCFGECPGNCTFVAPDGCGCFGVTGCANSTPPFCTGFCPRSDQSCGGASTCGCSPP